MYGGSSTSSKNRIAPSKTGSHGVPSRWTNVKRFPPTIGAVTRPPAIVRTYGIVRVAGHLAGAAARERRDGGVPGERLALGDPHRSEAGPVERREPGLLPQRDVQVRDVGEAHQRLRVRGDQVVVEVGEDLDRAGAAPEHLDHVDLGVGEQGVQVLGPLLGRPRDVVVLEPGRVGEFDLVAAVPPPAQGAIDVAAVEIGARRGHHADRAALGERPTETCCGDVGHVDASKGWVGVRSPDRAGPKLVRNEALTSVDLVLSRRRAP